MGHAFYLDAIFTRLLFFIKHLLDVLIVHIKSDQTDYMAERLAITCHNDVILFVFPIGISFEKPNSKMTK